MKLFFDTETTGFPIKNGNPAYTQPHLVQLACLLVNEDGVIQKDFQTVVRPSEQGWSMHEKAFEAHGITDEFAIKYGNSLETTLGIFQSLLDLSTTIICHNAKFDCDIMEIQANRIRTFNFFSLKKTFCTMSDPRIVKFCKIPNPGCATSASNFKYPKLSELHKILFGYEHENQHSAMSDVIATKDCYFELVKTGVING